MHLHPAGDRRKAKREASRRRMRGASRGTKGSSKRTTASRIFASRLSLPSLNRALRLPLTNQSKSHLLTFPSFTHTPQDAHRGHHAMSCPIVPHANASICTTHVMPALHTPPLVPILAARRRALCCVVSVWCTLTDHETVLGLPGSRKVYQNALMFLFPLPLAGHSQP